jgi:6,7-dimethyl-8-ribityllumazine synthase
MIIIIVAQFNKKITERLEKSAVDFLKTQNEKFEIVHVPGAVELPIAAQKIIRDKSPDVVMSLGCVIKGDTDHYEFVLKTCIEGLTRVALDESTPIIHGVLACRDFSAAWERREIGSEWANSALEMKKFAKNSSF